jgi:RNA polymerase sigma-70 factor (ECF subfamily)
VVDAARFDELVREHLPLVHRLAVRLCGSAGPAEDVAQDALLRAARGWRTFRGGSSFRTWMYRLTVNAWHDHHRRQHPPPPSGPWGDDADADDPVDPRGGGADDGAGGPPAAAAGRELAELVAARVSALPPRQRAVLVLIAYEQYSTAEAAAVLDTTEQNVRTTLHLARAKLREQLAPYLDPPAAATRAATPVPAAVAPAAERGHCP